MTKYTYEVEGPVYIVWMSWSELLQCSITVRPEVFDTRKEAVARVKELIAEDRSKGHESEYLR